jgi:hypothetical protein
MTVNCLFVLGTTINCLSSPGHDGKLHAGPEYDGKRFVVTGTTVKGLQRSDAVGVSEW